MDLRVVEWSGVYPPQSWLYTNLILSKKVTQNARDGPGSDIWSHGGHNSFCTVYIRAFLSIFQSYMHGVALAVAVTALEWTLSHPRPVATAGVHSTKAWSTLFRGAQSVTFESCKPYTLRTGRLERPVASPDRCIHSSPTLPTQNKSRNRQSGFGTLLTTLSVPTSKKMLFSSRFSEVMVCPDGPEWSQHRMERCKAAL